MAEKKIKVETPVVTQVPENKEVAVTPIPTPAPVPVLLSSGKWHVGPTTIINCEDCGKERMIAIQDAFQVTRCVECQKKAQNKKRNLKKKEANSIKRQAEKLAEAYRLVAEAQAQGQAQE